MNSFTPKQLSCDVPIGLAWMLGTVMESKGRQELFEVQRPEVLTTLRRVAMIQSAESSNRIEGVTVDAARLEPLVLGKVRPKDRSEEEVYGYRRALDWVHKQHDRLEVTPKTLKGLHERAQRGHISDAGQFKERDNDIIEVLPDGRRQLRFRTVGASETPDAMDQLSLAYRHTLNQDRLPPLLASASLVLDFLCIHPFLDGNGRAARLLTLLVLYHHGLRVGRYISLERIVEETKEDYYDALFRSSVGWHEAEHDPVPWWSYFLSTIRQAYREFEQRVEEINTGRGAKTAMVLAAIEQLPDTFAIDEVAQLCPSVSKTLIRNVLRGQRDAGKLEATSRGRGARWLKLA